ncbi:MAG: EscU/YscU/HrcU family type III secretion system export apparatus switch protein [Deltaproteobacteria bacterium]|nr:EscU/YscU/HrcU family type III secretion system export apparatus switch protein [Deltaproteobacteria bacterium]
MTAEKKSDTDIRHKKAVALRYDQDKDAAPTVVGKGSGRLAEKLLELAREHDIPIHEDADLVEVLAKLELNEQIPESTYFIVAEILAFVYRTNRTFQR